jgi:uncharacterized protein
MGGLMPSVQVGLFPLPNVVLLPGSTLPLQVFEPRYRAMVKDALGGEALIAMALLRPGYEGHYYTNTASIYPIVCVGRIREHIQIADGRYFINLVGVCRARVRDEDCSGDYRLATLEPMAEPPCQAEPESEFRVRQSLVDLLNDPLFQAIEGVAELQKLLAGCQPLGQAIDVIAGALLPTSAVEIRQRLLEEPHIAQRAQTLAAELRTLQRTLETQRSSLENWPRLGSMN